MTVRRVAVVLNGKAGALLEQPDAHAALETALAEAGLEAEFIPPDAGSLPDRVRMAADTGADAVLVAGGDGTVACAAQTLMGGTIPLGVLPFGTMNLLARDLGLPIGDLQRSMQAIAAGYTRRIDVGEVNGHAFLCASMLGLPVHLGRTREQTRGGGLRLWSRMARAAVKLVRRGRPLRVRLALDGRSRRVSTPSLTITVNPLDEANGRSFGRSVLDRGVLGVYMVRRMSLVDVVRLGVHLVRGRWQRDPAIMERHVKTVEIGSRARAVHVMNDGELRMLSPPLRYTIQPRALHVLVPQ